MQEDNITETTETITPKVETVKSRDKAKSQVEVQPVDPFPHKRHYADGSIFNLPVSYWAQFTEEQVRQKLVDAKNEEAVIDSHVALIAEALKFHGTEFGAAIVQEEAEE
jgi:hypothetical protein